jgi:DNA-binding transcriptional MocR family regulator
VNEPQTFADLQDAGNAQAQLILQAIARHANWEDGTCYPSQEALSKMAKCSDRTVRSYLAKLEKDGFITRSERRKGNGAKQSDLITLVGYAEWFAALRDGGKVQKPKAIQRYEQAEELSGSQPEEFSAPPGKLLSAPPGKQASGNKGTSLNDHRTKSAQAREDFKSDLKSEVGVQLTKTQHPDQIAAWRRYADLVGGQKNRFIVRMIDDHGACLVPSEFPPEIGLTEKSKRMSGEAA